MGKVYTVPIARIRRGQRGDDAPRAAAPGLPANPTGRLWLKHLGFDLRRSLIEDSGFRFQLSELRVILCNGALQ